MTLRFRPRMQDCTSIDVSGMWCQADESGAPSEWSDVAEISNLPARVGNVEARIGDLFEIERLATNHSEVERAESLIGRIPDQIWSGSSPFVHGIGRHMKRGVIWIDGSCGDFVGAAMADGLIAVRDNAGAMAGQSIRGGTLLIGGDTGDYCGAGRTGEAHGMNRGLIAVGGAAGIYAAAKMRRGMIWIAGAAAAGLGHGMKAGTVWVGGATGPSVGDMMVRGTIILNSAREIPDSHVRGGPFHSPVLRLLEKRAARQWSDRLVPHPKLAPHYDQFHGDVTCGSRGEILVGRRA